MLQPYEWLEGWRGVLDLYASTWILVFTAALSALWLAAGIVGSRIPEPVDGSPAPPRAWPRRRAVAGAALLLALCATQAWLHRGEKNPFLASSRPDLGIERWTNADGYATLLDGHLAQGDGLALLPLVRLFRAEAPLEPTEFDRRAGHLYLVSLVQGVLGTYWGFVGINVVAWWSASLLVWWLARRRWPGEAVPALAALLVATGQGFVFLSSAPQAHVPALAGFALVLALSDRLGTWQRAPARSGAARGAKIGWAAGAAGLVYLTYVPSLLFLCLYGAPLRRWRAILAASIVALALVLGWQAAGSAIGLRFSGGNNDLIGEAAGGWLRVTTTGVQEVLGHLHHGSLRGILVGAFYYPWWALAVVGLCTSRPEARRWSLAVLVAGALPAIAFATRFQLPRVAYFAYPAVYVLAAQGIVWLAAHAPVPARLARWGRPAIGGLLALGLALLSNADLAGEYHLTHWFHNSMGTVW